MIHPNDSGYAPTVALVVLYAATQVQCLQILGIVHEMHRCVLPHYRLALSL